MDVSTRAGAMTANKPDHEWLLPISSNQCTSNSYQLNVLIRPTSREYSKDRILPLAIQQCSAWRIDRHRVTSNWQERCASRTGTQNIRESFCFTAVDRSRVGGSTGYWETSFYEDLAGDALAGVDLLRSLSEVDPQGIGLHDHRRRRRAT